MQVTGHRRKSAKDGQAKLHSCNGRIEKSHLAMDFPDDIGVDLHVIQHSDVMQVVLGNADRNPEVKYLYLCHLNSTTCSRMTAS